MAGGEHSHSVSNRANYVNPSYRKSNHPSFQQKRHNLVIDSQGASNREVHTESGTIKFEAGVAVLPADSRARDIVDEMNQSADPAVKALHPRQYSLVENKPTVRVDTVHRFFFGSHPGLPWLRYDQFGRRIRNEEDTETTIQQEEQDAKPDESGNASGS